MTESIPNALMSVAHAIRDLGNADASTQMGGLEALGAVFKEIGGQMGDSLESIATAIENVSGSLDDVARAIREKGQAE